MPNVISVNFEGVESGVQSVHIPEGDYALKVTKVLKKKAKESGNEYLLFMLKVTAGNSKGVGKTLPHTCSLTKNALWNLRNLLEAAGKTIPPKAIKIDLDKLINLEMAASVVDDDYEGKKKSVVGSFFPKSELGAEEKAEPTEEDESEGSEESTEEGGEEEELFE